MTNPGRFAQTAAAIACGAYTAILLAFGIGLGSGRFLVAYIPVLVAGGVIVFDLWAWRWPGIIRLTGRPRLDGTWLTTLTPTENSHIPTGGLRGPISGATVIHQTFWSLHITQMTAQSDSESTVAELRISQHKKHSNLTYSYSNEAIPEHHERSGTHRGTCQLRLVGLAPQTARGAYWTERLTKGGIAMTLLDRSTGYPDLQAVQDAAETVGKAFPQPSPTA